MLRVENNLKKMAYLVFALRFFFNVSWFLEKADSHLGEFYFLVVCFPSPRRGTEKISRPFVQNYSINSFLREIN